MEVQAVSTTLKPPVAGANAGSASDSADAVNAFSALLQHMGAKFTTTFALGGLETKLMRSDETQAVRAPDPREGASQDTDRAAAKSKAAKADNDKNNANQDDGGADQDTAANQAAATDGDAQQAQAAVQAAVVAVAAQLPVIAQQDAPSAVFVAPEVAAAATTAPIAAVDQSPTLAPEAVIAATTETAAPVVQTVVAPVIEKTAAPIVAQAKSSETGARMAPVVTNNTSAQQDTASDDDALHAMGTDVAPEASATKQAVQGPENFRSAAAVEQSASLNRALGGETKIQVQVQVTGPAVANQAAIDPSPYNHFVGYSGGNDDAVANGQIGVADATNALVQSSKTPAEPAQAQAALPPAPVAPQPQTLPAQQGASSAARVDGPAPIAPAQSTGGQSSPQSNGFAFDGSGANTNSSNATSSTANAQAAPERPAVTAQHVIDQIKVNITRAAKAGGDRVTIQLRPEELGRIEVKLEMSDEQKVRVTVTADNKDTLALLQGDHRTLERALNDAGLRTDTNNLQFNLRSESDPRTADQGNGNGRGPQGTGDAGATDVAAEESDFLTYDYAAAARSRGGVDTFA